MTLRSVLVTGGCGFIGSHFVRHLLRSRPEWRVFNLDALTYAGNPRNLDDVAGEPRYAFLRGDVADARDVASALERGVDAIVNFAAESHVDRSILEATPFLRTNVLGTQVLLDAAARSKVGRFLQVSTDEVYGSLAGTGRFSEVSPLAPNSPYAASKAAADLLVRAAHRTHGLHATIARATNNFGPHQFPEKFLPLAITNGLDGLEIPVYGDGRQVRDWLYVEDHCEALLAVLERGEAGEIYNLGAENERENLSLAREVLRLLGRPDSLLRPVPDRPGHDRRYALDPGKARSTFGWAPARPFADRLAATVEWYRANEAWWRPLKGRSFGAYTRAWYGERLRSTGRFAPDDREGDPAPAKGGS